MVNAVALGGHTEGGEPMAILTLELPMRTPFGGRRLKQHELERVHLEKYRLDVLIGSGDLPFDEVTSGMNPPDFVVSTPSGPHGIECAAFALEKRRHAYDLFNRFRASLLDAARQKPFPHLANCSILIWFGSGNDLPPKRNDRATVDALVDMLRGATIDRPAITALADSIARDGFPESLADEPGWAIFSAGDAGGANINPVEPNSLQSDFARDTGFEVSLSMALPITASEVQHEIERIVAQHDQKGVDRLLISVGAPDRDGFLFPSESLVADQLPPTPVTTDHIQLITIHQFVAGEVRDLL
jgi:hypothetical protein